MSYTNVDDVLSKILVRAIREFYMNMNPLKRRMMEDSNLNRENKRKKYEKGYLARV